MDLQIVPKMDWDAAARAKDRYYLINGTVYRLSDRVGSYVRAGCTAWGTNTIGRVRRGNYKL